MGDGVKVKPRDSIQDLNIDTHPLIDFFNRVGAAAGPAFFAQQLGQAGGGGLGLNPYANQTFPAAAGPQPPSTSRKELTAAEKRAQMDAFQASGRASQDRVYANREARQNALDEAARRAAEFDARYSGDGGGGAARPDFSGYRNALMSQADELNARIQAMYNQLGEQAGANVGRIQDIYGGAQTGVGNIYDSAAGNIGQAFSSSQQQAADQMARLGIEAAAPAVMDPMALFQAQALSGLEGGRASGLSALERYGATASDFGSQMAQTAQQQGTEINAAILASLQNRLADSLAAEQAGGGGGGGRSMSVSDMLKLDEARQRYITGEPTLEERQQALREAQALADPVLSRREGNRELFLELTLPQNGQRPLMTDVEAEDFIKALESRGY